MSALLFRFALLAGIFCAAAAPTEAFAVDEERPDWLDIELGKSLVITTPRVPTAIAITDPEVAVAVTLGVANKIQVQGTSIGTTDLVVQFGPGVAPLIYEITVHRDLSDLVRRIDSIVEGEPPRVYPLGERIVVEGSVDDLDTLEQVALVSRIYDDDFVNLMQVRGDHQVQLEVVFAEVSRTAARSLGFNMLYGDRSLAATLQAPASTRPSLTNPQLLEVMTSNVGSGSIGTPVVGGYSLGAYISQINLVAILGTLDDYKVGKILAQPTLVALSGQKSEFLSGGTIPIPTPQGGAGQTVVTITYRDYGVNLWFIPTVLAGDVIDVQMYLEISEPDYANSVRVSGLDVPAFTVRKSQNHLRMETGMTFAVAGLLSEKSSFARVGIPWIQWIPVVGSLFRTISHDREETEVVIYVTPRLVRPLAPGEVPPAPGTTENNNPSDVELYLFGMNHRPNSRTAEPTGAVGLKR
ncbi:MAG: pilus assembly protein N-terminal domain-containing protein [Alphaproteobacteria bacterium]|nr:pilus assembly protein N-terminal domain-containing protein [Alphaproteobacteria bacterium]MCB9696202.1 pilus assembly protein N-terminal domain-containing protein [Alphaproteobacteria bacterium]